MSKSLKKLIDINRLREFKNKLVGTDSPCVQTGAVDQTIAGTKTFSKPIVGSVTGSSGSCTGNAATATTATTAKACTGNAASATKLATARSLWGHNFDGSAAITGTILGTPGIEFNPVAITANNGGVLDFHYNQSTADHTSRIIESASGTLSINNVTITTGKVVTAATFNGALKGNVTGNCSGSSGSCTGNAATATQFSANATVALTGDATGTSAGSKKGWSVPVTLANSGVTAGTYGPSADVTGNNNATISVPEITVDAKGRVTSVVNRTLTCKNNTYTVNNATLTIQKNGTNVATFTSNASSNATANITVPTKVSELTNDSGFLTSHQSLSNYVTLNGAQTIAGTKTFSKPIVGSVTGSSGSCTGNAATATKLAAKRTIALSGAATGTATSFDGSGNITIPVTALAASAIRAQWYAAYPDGAEAHNAMWGGRDITAAFNNGTFSTNVANGTFKDIFPGDYITKQVTISGTTYTVNWVIADCDYWINKGDTATTAHHVAIVPQQPIFTAKMNATNNTVGGYADSRMYTETIPACATGIVNAFGSSHILTFRDCATNDMNASATSPGLSGWFTGVARGVIWASMQCNLMSEGMVYGNSIWSSSGDDNCIGSRQMSAFRLSERLINYNRQPWWLRNVVSSAHFADVGGNGDADTSVASLVEGVRPFALLV